MITPNEVAEAHVNLNLNGCRLDEVMMPTTKTTDELIKMQALSLAMARDAVTLAQYSTEELIRRNMEHSSKTPE